MATSEAVKHLMECILIVFEKNWIRGYELALNEKNYSLFKKEKEIDY